MLRRALSDEHQALLCLKLCSEMEEVCYVTNDSMFQCFNAHKWRRSQYQCFIWMLFGPIIARCPLIFIVIRFIFAGRLANVWTPLRSFHRLCLRHVKLHKVKGARTSGLFETHTYPDVLFVCVSLFFCQTKPSPAGLKMCAVNCFVLAVVFCIACIVLYCIGFKVFVSVLVFCIGFSVLYWF